MKHDGDEVLAQLDACEDCGGTVRKGTCTECDKRQRRHQASRFSLVAWTVLATVVCFWLAAGFHLEWHWGQLAVGLISVGASLFALWETRKMKKQGLRHLRATLRRKLAEQTPHQVAAALRVPDEDAELLHEELLRDEDRGPAYRARAS